MRVLAVIALCSLAAAQKSPSPDALVDRLRSDDPAARDEAEDQLRGLGTRAVSALTAWLPTSGEIIDADASMRAARRLADLGAAARDELGAIEAAMVHVAQHLVVARSRAELGPTSITGGLRVTATRSDPLFPLLSELARAHTFAVIDAGMTVAELLEQITADNPFVRERAALLLGERRAAAAAPALRAGFATRHPDYAMHPGFAPTLQWNIRRHEAVRVAFALALIRIAPEATESRLAYTALLQAPDPEHRREAVMALGRAGDQVPASAYFLRGCLEDPDPRIAREAVTALGMLGRSAANAVPELERLCDSPDRQIAVRAAAALRQIRGR